MLLQNHTSFPDLCTQHRGPSCLQDPKGIDHAASDLLTQLRLKGAPVGQSSPPWTLDQKDEAIRRGPHQSTKGKESFIRDEFAAMVNAGHWLVVPYDLVRLLPTLKLSPTGVVPQRERRDRIIVDYTFSGVNQSTSEVAPDSLQFGHAFLRFMQRLHRADTRRGPIYMSKTDVADAFMRIWIHQDSVPTLAALLPSHGTESALVAIPMVLPMGWVHSPNYLCAVTETICDLANIRL